MLLTRRKVKWGLIAAAVLTFAAVAAYQFTGGKEYSSDLSGLRSQFNADKGKTRLLVLLAPT